MSHSQRLYRSDETSIEGCRYQRLTIHLAQALRLLEVLQQPQGGKAHGRRQLHTPHNGGETILPTGQQGCKTLCCQSAKVPKRALQPLRITGMKVPGTHQQATSCLLKTKETGVSTSYGAAHSKMPMTEYRY